MKPRVFIPQVLMKWDANTGGMVPKFDTMDSAKPFGELLILVNSPMAFAGRQECIDKIKHGLADFKDEDFFLPMGSHFFMMVAAMVLSRRATVQILEWNGRDQQYRKAVIDVSALLR